MNVIRCKIALIGDPRVGKTSIVNQLVKNSFNGSYQTTLGIEYNQYEVKIKDTNYTVQFHILDCTGFSVFREMINKVIRDVSFILYVYDSTNLESFQSIKQWKETTKEMDLKPNVIEYLVGNKTEIPEKIVTDKVSIDNLAKKLNFKSWQVSARGVKNLNELFEDMANIYYENYFKFTNKIKKSYNFIISYNFYFF